MKLRRLNPVLSEELPRSRATRNTAAHSQRPHSAAAKQQLSAESNEALPRARSFHTVTHDSRCLAERNTPAHFPRDRNAGVTQEVSLQRLKAVLRKRAFHAVMGNFRSLAARSTPALEAVLRREPVHIMRESSRLAARSTAAHSAEEALVQSIQAEEARAK